MSHYSHDMRPMKEEYWSQFHTMDMRTFGDDMMEKDAFMRLIGTDRFFSLFLGDRLAGYLILARYGNSGGHLGRIGVDPDFQGRGYGRTLMDYALGWFRSQVGIESVHLYTQDYNHRAQALYAKYGFKVTGTTWQYFVPFDSVHPKLRTVCEDIREDEIDAAGEKYVEALPADQIRRYLSSEGQRVLTLKGTSGNLLGVCRFTPSFPGCFPFELGSLSHFDDFIDGVRRHSLPQFDYVRITFTNNAELDGLCESRGYRLYHRMYRMALAPFPA